MTKCEIEWVDEMTEKLFCLKRSCEECPLNGSKYCNTVPAEWDNEMVFEAWKIVIKELNK